MDRPIVDPSIPYVGSVNSGAFKPGRLIRIQGNTPGVAYRFDVNLQCGPETLPRDDIALQVSIRILDGLVAINSLQNGVWGEEQQGSNQPVRRAEKFEIIIMCDVNRYKVAINGEHFADFPLRIHYDCITHLTIEGDVLISQITYENASPSGSRIPSHTPVLLRQIDDDFEIINANQSANDSVHPPSYSEVAHGRPYSVLPPYPVHDAPGMPKPTPYPMGVSDAVGTPYLPPSTSGIPSPPSGTAAIPVPLNAGTYNFRTHGKKTSQKCIKYLVAIVIGIIIIAGVIVSKVNRSKTYEQPANFQNDNNYYSYNNYGSYGNNRY